jgi:prepilin-type N-terminal cleavage/methylation domain-containing protein
MTTPRAAETRCAGFTLLEVLAAVLVLGMLYTVLADVAIQGLRAEGVAKRRIEASLRADALMSDLESQMVVGAAPPLSDCFDEDDGTFVTTTCVTAIELAAIVPELEVDPKAPSLLEPTGVTQEPRLRRVEVRVSWQEGDRELSVQRTTVAFDTTGLEEVFPPLEGPGGVDDLGADLENAPALDAGEESR